MIHALLANSESGSGEEVPTATVPAATLFSVTTPESAVQFSTPFCDSSPSAGASYPTLRVSNQWLDGRRHDEETQQWWQQERLATARGFIRDGAMDFTTALVKFKSLVDDLKAMHQAQSGPENKPVVFFRGRLIDDTYQHLVAGQSGADPGHSFGWRREVRTYIDAKLTTIGYIPDFKPFPGLPCCHTTQDTTSLCGVAHRALLHTPVS